VSLDLGVPGFGFASDLCGFAGFGFFGEGDGMTDRQAMYLGLVITCFVIGCAAVAPQPEAPGAAGMWTGSETLYPAPFHVRESDGHEIWRWGFINARGRTVVEPRYDDVCEFSEGLAAVNLGGKHGKDFRPGKSQGGVWGFIDETGRIVVPLKYEKVKPFSEGLGAVVVSGEDRFVFIDRGGTIVIRGEGGWPVAASFAEGLAAVRDGEDNWTYIDRSGRSAMKEVFVTVQPFSEGLAGVDKGRPIDDYKGLVSSGQVGYIDPTGRWVVLPRFSGGTEFREGLAAVNTGGKGDPPLVWGGKWGFIDNKGQWAIPPSFDWALPFYEGLAGVCRGAQTERGLPSGGLWGYVNRTGQVIIPFLYEDIGCFSAGLAPVCLKGKYGFIDHGGRLRIDYRFERAEMFREGLAYVRENGLWKYIAPDGKTVWSQSGN